MSIKEFGRNASFCGIMKKVMEQSKEPISCEEITVHTLEAWGRGFPSNPFSDISLIYKLLHTYLDVEEFYDDLKERPVVDSPSEGGEVPLNSNLPFDELNSMMEQIKRIKFKLRENVEA